MVSSWFSIGAEQVRWRKAGGDAQMYEESFCDEILLPNITLVNFRGVYKVAFIELSGLRSSIDSSG